MGESTLASLGGRFEVEEIEARSLKGKEKPVRRFNVVQLVRKLTDVGIPLPDDLKATIDKMYPEVTGG